MASLSRRAVPALAVASLVALLGTRARADDAPRGEAAFCSAARARAASQASLMMGPTFRTEALKLPAALQRGNVAQPTLAGPEYQVRGSLSISPLGIYRGLRVLDLADADCSAHAATTAANDVLDREDVSRLQALRKQAAYLAAQRTAWEAVVARMEERFAARVVTLAELRDVRAQADELARAAIAVDGDVARLEAKKMPASAAGVSKAQDEVVTAARRYEEKASHVRSLDAWDVTVTAGLVPPIFDVPRTDAFGVVSVSYNFGGPFHNAAESRYVEARTEQVRHARQDVVQRLDTLRRTTKASRDQAAAELALEDAKLARIAEDRKAIEPSDSPAALRAVALLDLEGIRVEARRTYFRELVTQLSHMEDN